MDSLPNFLTHGAPLRARFARAGAPLSTDVIQLTLTLKMTTAQVVETSVTVSNNSPIQDYVHPDDQTQPTFENDSWVQTFHSTLLVEFSINIACYEKKATIPGFTRIIRKSKGLQKSLKTVDLCTYQCKAGGGWEGGGEAGYGVGICLSLLALG